MTISRCDPGAKNRKGSYKMPKEGIELILAMTVSGASNIEIKHALEEQFGVSIHQNMFAYYRRKYSSELETRYREELLDAHVHTPELATLSGRLRCIERLISAEFAKGDKMSGAIVAKAIQAADIMIHRAELNAMNRRLISNNQVDEETHESILREIERRSHLTE